MRGPGGYGLVGGLSLAAEREQVDLDAGPVTVVVVKGPVQAGRSRWLTAVGGLQSRDEQHDHEDE